MNKQAITMPVLSDTMETGHLTNWLKKPGDQVKKGDVLAEVESDKAIMDVEAFSDGYLAGPLAEVGSDIPVKGVIGYIADSADTSKPPGLTAAPLAPSPEISAKEQPEVAARKAVAESAKAAPILPASHTTSVHSISGKAAKISPYARALAQELGIDPTTIAADFQGVIHAPQILAAALQSPQPNLDAGPEWHYKLLTPMRRAVAENMIATLNTPTFRISSVFQIDPLHLAAREVQLSFTLLLARALALAVKAHPLFNEVYTSVGLVTRKRVDVGIAADIPHGLVTPVIRDAAERPIKELATNWNRLKEKLARQRLTPDEYEGATIYLSNLGVFDVVTSFEAIVPLGAAAILSVGAAKNGMANFVLSCDHRVIYGADAARFMQTFEHIIEKPGDWLTC